MYLLSIYIYLHTVNVYLYMSILFYRDILIYFYYFYSYIWMDGWMDGWRPHAHTNPLLRTHITRPPCTYSPVCRTVSQQLCETRPVLNVYSSVNTRFIAHAGMGFFFLHMAITIMVRVCGGMINRLASGNECCAAVLDWKWMVQGCSSWLSFYRFTSLPTDHSETGENCGSLLPSQLTIPLISHTHTRDVPPTHMFLTKHVLHTHTFWWHSTHT